MLVEFTVGNFRSFDEPVTLSMVAANIVSADKTLDENNVFQVDDGLTLLTSAAIYGANASGKTNISRALAFMISFTRNSLRYLQDEDPIPVEPFRLTNGNEKQPSLFEMVFLLDGKQYRYGFQLNRQRVMAEWLFVTRTTKETKLFMRDKDAIQCNEKSFKEGRNLNGRTRPNASFLAVVAQFNGPTAKRIMHWLRDFNVISGLRDNEYLNYTLNCIEQGTNKAEIEALIRKLDLSIEGFEVERAPNNAAAVRGDTSSETDWGEGAEGALQQKTPSRPKALPAAVRTAHPKFDAQGRRVGEELLDLNSHESEGTRKLFAFAGPLVIALQQGQRLFIDEMDARLHPLITSALIKLFHDKQSNPKGAQLIFVTHDTNLLSNRLFRRDQIWFAEKDGRGATHLYSLVEYKLDGGAGVRNDASFENDYIRGRYGAIPFLGDLKQVINESHG